MYKLIPLILRKCKIILLIYAKQSERTVQRMNQSEGGSRPIRIIFISQSGKVSQPES